MESLTSLRMMHDSSAHVTLDAPVYETPMIQSLAGGFNCLFLHSRLFHDSEGEPHVERLGGEDTVAHCHERTYKGKQPPFLRD